MSHKHSIRAGFTIIELMLAMTFVSFLLMAVALITVQVGNTYNRGLTIKSVNQAGRDVSDSLRRDIRAAKHSDIRFVAQTTAGAQNLNRLCLGHVSYIWNYGRAIYENSARTYSDNGRPIVLARVNDASGAYCTQVGGAYPATVTRAAGSDLLEAESLDMALHQFTFSPIVVDAASAQAAYHIAFTVGTNDQSVIDTSNQQCRPPEGGGEANFDFCAINRFETVIRAGGAQ